MILGLINVIILFVIIAFIIYLLLVYKQLDDDVSVVYDRGVSMLKIDNAWSNMTQPKVIS